MTQRLDVTLTTDVPSGVYYWPYRAPDAATRQRLVDDGWRLGIVHLGAADSKADMLKAFQRDLDLPDWFGHNWDALNDALADWSADIPPRLLIIDDASTHPDRPGRAERIDVIVSMLSDLAASDPIRYVAIYVGSRQPDGALTIPEL